MAAVKPAAAEALEEGGLQEEDWLGRDCGGGSREEDSEEESKCRRRRRQWVDQFPYHPGSAADGGIASKSAKSRECM